MRINSAMILAAGLGTRMRPITETLPKPLVEVAGKPLIAYSLEALGRIGVTNIVANVHYLAPILARWLTDWPGAGITISDETETLLDSGGGIVKALPHLGSDPFLVLNADTFWLEDPVPALTISLAWQTCSIRPDGHHDDDGAARPGHRTRRIWRFHHQFGRPVDALSRNRRSGDLCRRAGDLPACL
jgi:CTP:molybdopterin cytidylyltransferase MocA